MVTATLDLPRKQDLVGIVRIGNVGLGSIIDVSTVTSDLRRLAGDLQATGKTQIADAYRRLATVVEDVFAGKDIATLQLPEAGWIEKIVDAYPMEGSLKNTFAKKDYIGAAAKLMYGQHQ